MVNDEELRGLYPERILKDPVLLEALGRWEAVLGSPNEKVDERTVKVAYELLTAELISNSEDIANIHGLNVISSTTLTDLPYSRSMGGYGVVVKIQDKGKDLAVKYIREIPDNEDELKRQCIRYAREVHIWKRMIHPNILPLCGIWINFYEHAAPLPALVSPWVKEGDLWKYLTDPKKKPIPIKDRLKIVSDDVELRDVLSALDYMHNHELRVTHGDLRASNILLDDEGTALICDFGLSRADDGTKGLSTSQKGNSRWMAPERAQKKKDEGGRPTPESDIFEFGVTFWEIVTGKTPWESMHDLSHRFDEGRSLRRPVNMPDDMWSFVQACMAVSPAERPTSGEALKRLQSFLDAGVDWE